MATDPNMPAPEPLPPLGPEPGLPGGPKPSVPPTEDGQLPEPPIQLPGQPGLPERVT
jgi:hypothetical protein